MGLFSRSKSSSSSTISNVDKRLVVDGGSIGISADNSTVTLTDQGAIAHAFDFAKSSNVQAFDLAKSSNVQTAKGLAAVLGLASGALRLGDDSSKRSLDASREVKAAYDKAAEIASGNTTLIYAGLGVLGIGALAFAFMRGR